MNFVKHSDLEGLHAFLGASKYHWINYDDKKIADSYKKYLSVLKGTELHEFASMCIRLNQKLPQTTQTLNMFVNDAIGFKMTSEQVLFYSENCFGTADAISFRDNHLRIHDLKTGANPTHMEQLKIYAALFCLEYKYKPKDIDISLRIYQSDEIIEYEPTAEEIQSIINKIVSADKIITKLKKTLN